MVIFGNSTKERSSEMKQFPYPALEAGEKLVEAAGLLLVYDKQNNLIFMRCINGNPFFVQMNAYWLLELLGRYPGNICSHEKLLICLYDLRGEKRPDRTLIFSNVANNLKSLRREFKRKTGSDPIISHYGQGYSLPL